MRRAPVCVPALDMPYAPGMTSCSCSCSYYRYLIDTLEVCSGPIDGCDLALDTCAVRPVVSRPLAPAPLLLWYVPYL